MSEIKQLIRMVKMQHIKYIEFEEDGITDRMADSVRRLKDKEYTLLKGVCG